jgi:TATA-box binding protein (TBP) (component of TFIID and TFIIIB)
MSCHFVFHKVGRFVPVPDDILAKADPVLLAALKTFIQTNIVCTARKSRMRPIEYIAWSQYGMYKRPGFSSCVGTSFKPRAAWTSFRQGHIRCAGGSRSENALVLISMFAFKLYLETGMPFRTYNFSIQNYVTALKLPYQIDIVALNRMEPTRSNLEEASFPGLQFKFEEPKEGTASLRPCGA